MTINSRHRQRAARHAARAQNYRRQAQLLLEADDLDCAAALIYEAAKQGINSIANQQGQNPGSTGGKERFLYQLAEQGIAPSNLERWWQSADQLHIYADRENLSRRDYMEAWARAEAFIAYMLSLYAGPG